MAGYTLFALFLILPSVLTQSLSSVFTVASGNVPGSCDQFTAELDLIFSEATDMALSAVTALNQLSQGKSTLTQRRTLFSLFGININEASTLDTQTMSTIKGIYSSISKPSQLQTLNPRLFCDASFLTFTHFVMDETTNQPTTEPITNLLPEATLGAYWYPDKKEYFPESKATNGGNACGGTTRGFSLGKTKTVVLCPSLFASSWQKSLDSVKGNQLEIQQGTPLDTEYMSLPAAFLHELTHMVTDGLITDQPTRDEQGNVVQGELSYGFQDCFNLAMAYADQVTGNANLAAFNADSYSIFALTTWLGQWDWCSGKSLPAKYT